uniref:Uncharacterized protein n=1 Tax=Anguilla anguilla TaxID=7936 RepID=A0A0E9UXX6_ANGAN
MHTISHTAVNKYVDFFLSVTHSKSGVNTPIKPHYTDNDMEIIC